MTYEIPQQLEYKEKIIFGLTFRQLAYALGFGLLAFLCYRNIAQFYLKFILIIISCLAGAGFMFLNLEQYLKNWRYFLSFRQAKLLQKKMDNFIGIEKVEGHLAAIKQKKKNYRIAVVKVEPINFVIRNEKEKDAIIKNFQKFLNSLDFPIQILMTTDSLNLDVYLKELEERVEKQKNKDYEKLFDSYKEHLDKVLKEADMMDRSFYIIIPERAGEDIEAQIHVIREKLDSMGLSNKLLEGDSLTQTFTRFFNDLLEDDDKSSHAAKKVGKDNLFRYTISPKLMKNKTDYFQINDKANRIIAATGYPRAVEPGFLDKIITTNGDFDLSLHIEPYDIETTMVNLNKELQKQRADLFAEQNKDIINPSLEIQFNDTKKTLENLQKGNEKLFNISLYINCKAKYLNHLNLLSKKVESELNSAMIIPKKPFFRMAQGIKSVMPICHNELNISRNITTEGLSAFFPFTSQFLQIDNSGVWLGQNKNNIPIIKDIFKLTNPNGCILASSGAGKSYAAKLMISRQLLNGAKVIVVDPQSEYAELAKQFKGQLVNISRTSDTIINPLDLMGHDYAEKRLALIDLFNVMLGGTSEIQKAVLDRALTRTYQKKGITNDQKTWDRTPPIMEDLLAELELMSKGATIIEKETYRSLINRLSMYVSGVFNFLNRQTKINFDNRFVCFNIGNMPKQVKPVVMFLILDYVYMKMKKDKERKLLVIDEAWNLLQNQEEDSYIFEIVKTCRKFNLGLLLITQDVGDLLKSNAGLALLSNSAYTILLRQKPSIIDSVENTFRLSQNEKTLLLTANKGEGIFICENEHSELKIVASEEEDKIITTNPDVLAEREKGKKEEEEKPKESKPNPEAPTPTPTPRANLNINLDLEKRYFKKKDLSVDDIDYLLNNGYILSSHVPLGGGQRYDYLLKPFEGESTEHFFLIKAVEEYLRNFTDNIELFATKKPDIIFKADGKEWAFEIETGTVFHKNPPQFFNKVNLLKKGYGTNFLFIVTESKYTYVYNRFGKTYTRKNIERKIRSLFKKNAQHTPQKSRSEKAANCGGNKPAKNTAKKQKSRLEKRKKPAARKKSCGGISAMNKTTYYSKKSHSLKK